METYGAGVVVFLFNEKEHILIGKRKGAHGAGTWSLPGGKIDFLEKAIETAARELSEETSVIVPPGSIRPREWLDNIWVDEDKGQQHWITLFTEANLPEGQQAVLMEPDKCAGWLWTDPAKLMDSGLPLFFPLRQYFIEHPWGTWPRYLVDKSWAVRGL